MQNCSLRGTDARSVGTRDDVHSHASDWTTAADPSDIVPAFGVPESARVRIQDPVCPFVRDNRESTRFAMSLLSCASQRNALVFTPPRSRLAKRYRHTVVIRH